MARETPGLRITIVRGQLSQEPVDAIVNAAPSIDGLARGAHAYIWDWDRRQRKELDALIKNQSVAVGKAVAGSGGKLAARWVIHTVYPESAASDDDFALLSSCYHESLAIAAELGARSVGFARMVWPASEYAEVRTRAAWVAVSAAMTAPDPIEHVVFASPDPAMVAVYTAVHEDLSQLAEHGALPSAGHSPATGQLKGDADMPRQFSPEAVIEVLANDVRDERFIGTYVSMPAWESVNFGIEYAGGYSTVVGWPPPGENVADPWWLHLVAGLAFQVADIDGALRWVNAKNRSQLIGRYMVAVSEDLSLGTVVYHMSVSSVLIGSDADEIWIWMTRLMTHAAKTAATESHEFIKAHGGSLVGEGFLAALAMIALSP